MYKHTHVGETSNRKCCIWVYCLYDYKERDGRLYGSHTGFLILITFVATWHVTKYTVHDKSFFLNLFIFRQRGREGEREGEKHQCVVVYCMSPLGTWPTTQTCASTRNRTSDPLVLRPALNPLSHTSQGCSQQILINTGKEEKLGTLHYKQRGSLLGRKGENYWCFLDIFSYFFTEYGEHVLLL